MSHARADIFKKKNIDSFTNLYIGMLINSFYQFFHGGLYLATQIELQCIFTPVVSGSFCSSSQYKPPVGGFEPCPYQHFPKARRFFLPVSRLASELIYYIQFLVLGCTWLLKVNHGTYSYLLLKLASVTAVSMYFLSVGYSN